MHKKWVKRKEKQRYDEFDSAIDKIGKIRGIKDIKRFLNPTKNEMFDPYLLKGIDDASSRILDAIQNDEDVVISYDADVDGLTSGSMMYRYLKEYIDNVEYIYNQRSHGHGIYEQTRLNFVTDEDVDENGKIINEDKLSRYELNSNNLDIIKDADLLIIIDSSSNDAKTCKMIAEDYGVDIVIIDHHVIDVDNPYVIMVNPQQEGCQYPNKHLSGAGVTFKVIEVMEDKLGDFGIVDPYEYIDLVAVGMYADIMPVNVLENRFMIMHGLRNIQNVGLKRILKGAKADLHKLDGDSIGFSIAPMINGVTRLDNIELAIEILLTDDDDVAKKLRLQMHKLNEKRKEMQKEIVENYRKNIRADEKILIVTDDNSSRGFNGLVAQQLATLYQRPVFVGRLHGGTLSGSFRSFGGFDVKEFFSQSGLVDEVAGHNYAGGITMAEENVELLRKYIDDNMPEPTDRKLVVMYDLEISVNEVNDYIDALEQYNLIAGNGFPKVIVKVNDITVEESNIIGRTMETRKITTFEKVELIKFKVDENYASELGYFDTVSVVGQLHMNSWFNFQLKKQINTPQIIIEDYIVT